MTSDRITLETKMSDNQLVQKTYALKPSLKNKFKVEPGTDVTVTYNKSDQVARSVTVQ
jgi:hypothetical protein